MSNLILPENMFKGQKPPEWFTQRLHHMDPALLCYWNPFKKRFVIDRYICAPHDHDVHGVQCQRIHVMFVQGDHGEYRPCSESILEKLGAMDSWRKFKSADEQLQDLDDKKQAWDEKTEKSIRDDARHIILDNRQQFVEMQTLIQRHDIAPNDASRMPTVTPEEAKLPVLNPARQG